MSGLMPKDAFWAMQKFGSLGRYISMGGALEDLEISRDEFRALPKSQRYREGQGKNRKFFRLPGQDDITARTDALREAELQQSLDLYDSLDKVPILANLKEQALGNTGLDETYKKAFDRLGEQTLGAAAPGGFLRDQAPWLVADTALKYAELERGIQKQAENQYLSAVGLPGYGGAPYSSLGGMMADIGSHGQYANQFGQAAGWILQDDWQKDAAAQEKRGALYGAGLGLLGGSLGFGGAFGAGGLFG